MNLTQPYYIEPRTDASHLTLDGKWDFCWSDQPTDAPSALTYAHSCTLPHAVYHCLHEAGVLPDPYHGTNSKLFHWGDEKIWYFRRVFSLHKPDFHGHAFLCLDGAAYFTKLWINGTLLGEHEGMFGGPCADLFTHLNLDGENELIIEVKAANYANKADYPTYCRNAERKELIPWNIIRDSITSTGDFHTFGIWNHVRLELLPTVHMSRPYMYTESIQDGAAQIHFEVEIADGHIRELRPYLGRDDNDDCYTRAFDTGLTGAQLDSCAQIEILFRDGDDTVFSCREPVPFTDWEHLGMMEKYHELTFYQKDFLIKDPVLWYPYGLGEPHLYQVTLRLYLQETLCDEQSFPFGIRIFRDRHTPGQKYRAGWGKFLFSVNGEDMFLKGMNWLPMDYLYDISPERYEWCLRLVKNAGIQLLRVWNGGGFPETDTFYSLCDKLGILVWQDQYLANTNCSSQHSQQVLECQLAYNLYRLRNHPSLVIICGGNEFNPYTQGNAAAMFVTQRTVQMLIPDRIFHYTTADRGSAHIYIDMEPTWYRHLYQQLPFVGESGIHCFPNYKTLCLFLDPKETDSKLGNISDPSFAQNFPGLINHFTEYLPDRVPRMLARISQITDISDCTLKTLCEAAQVQAYEFYQLMIQAMHENYPFCGGIMPWALKRPWPTVGIQTIDGDDRPCMNYYAVQNAYRAVNVCWCQQWSILAPEEALPMVVKILHEAKEDFSDATVTLTVYAPDLSVFAEYSAPCAPVLDFGMLSLPAQFTNKCFLVCADLVRNGESIARSVYFNKCTDILSDPAIYQASRTAPTENLHFSNGPWLKDNLVAAKPAVLEAQLIQTGLDGSYPYAELCILNESDTPAYPVTIDTENSEQRVFLSDNFFLLKPQERKCVRITCDSGQLHTLRISLWNGSDLLLKV